MKIAYVADDGTVFDTEKACLTHEYGHYASMIVEVISVKRKRFVHESGIRYPIRDITVIESYGKGMTELIHLEFNEYGGLRLNGLGIKKGTKFQVKGRMKAKAYVKDKQIHCFICMKDPTIFFLRPVKRH